MPALMYCSSSASECSRVMCPDSPRVRSEEHTSELQSQSNLVCRLLLEKKKMHLCTVNPRQLAHHGLHQRPESADHSLADLPRRTGTNPTHPGHLQHHHRPDAARNSSAF